MATATCDIAKNLKACSCTYPGCSRRGKCCECLRYHLENDELTGCCFAPDIESTYDRSFSRFASLHR